MRPSSSDACTQAWVHFSGNCMRCAGYMCFLQEPLHAPTAHSTVPTKAMSLYSFTPRASMMASAVRLAGGAFSTGLSDPCARDHLPTLSIACHSAYSTILATLARS